MLVSRSTLAAALLTTVAGCGGLMAGTYQDAVGRWHSGDHRGALSAARAEYAKWRDGNDLSQAEVERSAREAFDELDSVPVLPSGDTPRVGTDTEAMQAGPEALQLEVRGDLLSERVTPVMRAIAVVRDFQMASEVPTLLAVVFRRKPLQPDDGVLAGAPLPLVNVAAKWGALQVLEGLIGERAVRPTGEAARPATPPRSGAR